jgi:hypothetical protein
MLHVAHTPCARVSIESFAESIMQHFFVISKCIDLGGDGVLAGSLPFFMHVLLLFFFPCASVLVLPAA